MFKQIGNIIVILKILDLKAQLNQLKRNKFYNSKEEMNWQIV